MILSLVGKNKVFTSKEDYLHQSIVRFVVVL